MSGNPISNIDPLGLSKQDVQNAYSALLALYPGQFDQITVLAAPFLSTTGADGYYIPGDSSTIWIASDYFDKQCLSDQEKAQLQSVIAHEALHVFLNDQVGTLNYLWNNSSYGYHDWVYDTAAAITFYQRAGPVGSAPPSIYNYPTGPKHR